MENKEIKQQLLRKLPKVDKLIDDLMKKEFYQQQNYQQVYEAVKEGIENFRNRILSNELKEYELVDIENYIETLLKKKIQYRFKKVINGTGTILHTNLGRAFFSKELLEHLGETLSGYSNLEFDLETGERGSRYSHIEDLIAKVTGAEAALVVNNNAAAVMLCLNEFAKEKEVVISRGELVEVGGSFRIPDIMELSGAKLIEVGTTNRTHEYDYERVINENTSILLKVHTSNYHISGFTKSVGNSEIVEIAKRYNLISMEDLGSGVLVDFSKYGIKKEPTIQESLASGMDIVTISGDKLLGGPQCGIILGKKEYIKRLKKNQFLRAFRVCKMTISALEYVFKQYLDEKNSIEKIPTLNRILEKKEVCFERAKTLSERLSNKNIENEIIDSRALIGGGSMPGVTVDSYAIVIKNIDGNKLERFLMDREIPIVGRVQNNEFQIDIKTIYEVDYKEICQQIENYKIGL